MKCPRCHETFTERCSQCPNCGAVFSKEASEKISLYFDVKEQLSYLHTLKTYLDTSLGALSGNLNRLEALVTDSLNETANEPYGISEAKIPKTSPDSQVITEFEDNLPTEFHVRKSSKGQAEPETALPQAAEIGEGEFRFGQKWLLIIGIITMVFAVGYFLKYSFTKGWVGPAGRIALSYFWGMAFLGMGEWFRKKELRSFGLSLAGGGIAVLYFSTFAGFQLYHIIPMWLSFALMILITIFSCVLAVVYDAKWLAALGTLGGFLTPLFLSPHHPQQLALMSYMAILNLGILALATKKNWRLLESLGFVFTWLLYTGWYAPYYKINDFWPSITFLMLFFIIYALLPVASTLYHKQSRSVGSLWFAAPNALIAFGFAFAMVAEKFSTPYVSIVTLFIAIVFLTLANWLSEHESVEGSAFWYLIANAVFFLVLTVPILFSSNWITIFWALEAAFLLWLGLKLDRKWMTITGIVLTLLVTGKLFLYDYPVVFRLNRTWSWFKIPYTQDLLERLLTLAALLGSLFWGGRKLRAAIGISWNKLGSVFTSIFGASLFLALTIETAAFFHQYAGGARFASISVLWAIFASLLMVQGFRLANSTMRKTAIGIFLVTLFKVFFMDISHFTTPFRILSFLVLGLLLIGSSWLYHRFRGKLLTESQAINNGNENETK
ncbi:MAG: hypothetical protein DRJ14_01550 [Acidobacteria bacterium]|nr:MAG: hypothetical protein DRJ14_01550 [Acidobacteriota bacterium]